MPKPALECLNRGLPANRGAEKILNDSTKASFNNLLIIKPWAREKKGDESVDVLR